MSTDSTQTHTGKWPAAALISILVIAGLFVVLELLGNNQSAKGEKQLVVYCAAGLKIPVEKVAKAYTEEFGIPIKIESASSGVLEGKLKQDATLGKTVADLYIPADHTFSQRTQKKGLTRESLPIAKFHLVLAVKPNDDLKLSSLEELISKDIPYAVCSCLLYTSPSPRD